MLVASTKIGFSGESSRSSAPSLFLEATQRKTVRTVEEILRDDPGVVEVQVVGTGAGHRRRPTEPVDADTPQCTVTFVISGVAEARGCRSAREPGLPGITCIVRAPAKSCSNAYPAFERFRYLRRGARCLEGTALRPGRPRLRRAAGAARYPRPPPAGLCKEKPNLRVPSGTEPRPGWRRLARPIGSQLFNWVDQETTLPHGHCPRAFFRTAVSKRRAARRLPPRRVRNIRFAHLRPRRRRTEELLHSMVIGRAPWRFILFCD